MTNVTVVGSGPNGLAAALVAARAGYSVRVIESNQHLGGGMRSAELVESGYLHDICSAVHPMAFASPFFQELNIRELVDFRTPELSFAHAISPGKSAYAWRDLTRTIDSLGLDGRRWQLIFGYLVQHKDKVLPAVLDSPLNVSVELYGRLLNFGARALLARPGAGWFRTEAGAALFAGLSAHAINRVDTLAAALIGMTLGVAAHGDGWPLPVGGSQAIVDVMVKLLREHGVEFETGHRVTDLRELSSTVVGSNIVFLDVSAKSFVKIAGNQLNPELARKYQNFSYGPGIAKVDYTLNGPVPWLDQDLSKAGTIHAGGTVQQLIRAESAVVAGRYPEEPFLLVVQPSHFDESRAPKGKHVLWAYTHVPSGSTIDQSAVITAAIEKLAPGFRDQIRGQVHTTAADEFRNNVNYVGGDIGAGANTLRQLLMRPTFARKPWRTPIQGVYLCSASTAPGAGVHGMCGVHAAETAIIDQRKRVNARGF